MLFFKSAKKSQTLQEKTLRPKTISEIKKLQSFIKEKKANEGESLNESVKKFASKD